MDVYPEKSGVKVTIAFEDDQSIGTLPLNAYWRLDCAATGKALQDWTVITPTLTNESGITEVLASIEIPGSLNAIQRNGNRQEQKTLLVTCNKDTPTEFSQEITYYVRNLQGRN